MKLPFSAFGNTFFIAQLISAKDELMAEKSGTQSLKSYLTAERVLLGLDHFKDSGFMTAVLEWCSR